MRYTPTPTTISKNQGKTNPPFAITLRIKGAVETPVLLISKNVSARKPSPTINTTLSAGGFVSICISGKTDSIE